jgi:hypothetical protein
MVLELGLSFLGTDTLEELSTCLESLGLLEK